MESLEDAIKAHLPLIDEMLTQQGTALSSRPLGAAIFFVTDIVLEVSNDTKEDFYAKPWFAIIYHHIHEWYRETYGKAFERHTDKTATGVVLIRGIATEIVVPLTTWHVQDVGKTGWLGFPDTVTEGENPLEWLTAPPNLERLTEEERAGVEADCRSVATALRATRINLMGIDPSDATTDGLLAGVLPELEAAARHILLTKETGPAIWSLQMALERTMKALSQQRNGTFLEQHDLFRVLDSLDLKAPQRVRNRLRQFPRHHVVVEGRYGLGTQLGLSETMQAYDAALDIVSELGGLFKRRIRIGGSRFLLQSPPWTTMPVLGAHRASDDDKGSAGGNP